MNDVMAVVVMRARRCSRSARYRTHAPADCRTDAGTASAAGDRADHSSRAGADQAAAERALSRIVRICIGRRCNYQRNPDQAG
jgi:hypothetical protein